MSDVKYYLAVDLGASSGRLILAHMEDGKIVLEEMHRFWNGNDKVQIRGKKHRIWDTERIFGEIITGMKKCAEAGKIPVSMGVDTWGVDYCLIGADGKKIGYCYGYRDHRTEGMREKVYEIVPERELYEHTGIQYATFNTIYQLMAAKLEEPETLEAAQAMLQMPDYFHYCLTGVAKQEYTEASTGQLLSVATNDWDWEIIDRLGFPRKIFQEICMPGTYVGNLKPEVQKAVGFDCKVIMPATHDTGSAVMSVPSEKEDTLYISSGTWSLMGCELQKANTSEAAMAANFTNEGGYDHRYRFLRNIMGLWMIQSVKAELEAGYEYDGRTDADDYSFANLCDMASKETIDSLVEANDERFLAPESMIAEVQKACEEAGMQVPKTPWQLARVIYRSLAVCYKDATEQLEQITGKHFEAINIVGGGSNASWLNELTAKETGRTVLAGPGEATAIGNVGCQMLADGVFKDLFDLRRTVYTSFGVKRYEP